MAKCDVCGKTSLLPERFGATNVCKACFLKVNGPFWKYRTFEKYNDVVKQRAKTLESARTQNFPESVLTAIDAYFHTQMEGMLRCDGCGQTVQTLEKIGKAKLCKHCFSKINTKEWKETAYYDNDEVEEHRKKVLKIAQKRQFPPIVIAGINEHFDSKIQEGLFYVKFTQIGQTLKIFDTHCILITHGSFDVDEASRRYGAALKRGQPKADLFSSGATATAVHSLLKGNVVQAGISLATNAAVSAAVSYMPTKGMFRVHNGEYRIDYQDFDKVEYQSVGDGENDVGYLRFQSRYSHSADDDVVFLFTNNHKMAEAHAYISEKLRSVHTMAIPQQTSPKSSQAVQVSVADEIMKFKNLLDLGIITQEEFEKKKKELLGG